MWLFRYSGQTTTMPPTRRRTQLQVDSMRRQFRALIRIQALVRRYIVRRLYTSLRFAIRLNEYFGLSGGANPGRVRVGVDRPYTSFHFEDVRGRTGRDEYTGDAQLHMINPNPFTTAADVQGFLAWNPPEGMVPRNNHRPGPYPVRRRHPITANW